MTDVTVVTSFYDIRNMENNTSKNKTTDTYLEKGKFILELPCNLIIFTEEKFREFIIDHRKDFLDKTVIITQPLDETYYWKYKEIICKLQDTYIITNRDKYKDTPLYIILIYSKFYFLEKSIELDPYNTSKFLWIDFGITHVAQNSNLIYNWLGKISDKIRLMEMVPYNSENPKEYFKKIYHNHAAGLISGSKAYMLNFIDLFRNLVNKVIDNGWYQLDEALITIIVNKYPDYFDIYYGNYRNIISNYHEYTGGKETILSCVRQYRSLNNKSKVYHILRYMKSYFITQQVITDEVLTYFYHYLLVNFYMSSSRYLDEDILTYFLETTDEKIIKMLYMNIVNIRTYKNTKPLLNILMSDNSDNSDDSDDSDDNINNNIVIGVAIPVIKRDIIHITRCLDSIESQTRKPDSVVISLSGYSKSTDTNIDIPDVNKYSYRVRIVQTEEMKNASSNRNLAGSLLPANTDIICFFDCDDEMYPERLEYIEKTFIKYNDDFILHNYTTITDPHGNTERDKTRLRCHKDALVYNSFLNATSVKSDIKITNRTICHGHLSVKYNIWMDEKYDESINDIGEDTEYCRRLLKKGYSASYIETKLSIYHKYKLLDYLYKKSKSYRLAGKNKDSYTTSQNGLKLAITLHDASMADLFYNELSIVSYYVKDMKMGLYSCDMVILSNHLDNSIKSHTLENNKFYLNRIPINYEKKIDIPIPIEFRASSPSIIYCSAGGYICIVRCVNYSIMGNGNYNIRNRQGTLITKNYMFHMDNDFNIISKIYEVVNKTTQPRYPCNILGLEDSRIFYHNNYLCLFSTSLEYNQRNTPQICYSETNIENSTNMIDEHQESIEVTKLIPLQMGNITRCEKNWLPFVVDRDILFIYMWDPFILCSLDSKTGKITTKINKRISQYDLTGFRGSAPPIPYKDGFLCTIHYVTKVHPLKYYHRFIYLSRDFETIKIGKGFYFIKADIEYNLSLIHSDKGLIMATSYRDNTAEIKVIDYDTVDEYINYL